MFEQLKIPGYTCKTTFWCDFSIADRFGPRAIRGTFKDAFREWHDNAEYLTELVLVLNHKIWYHYNNGNMQTAEIYNELWSKCAAWAESNLTGDDLSYYYRVTD